MLAEFPVFDIKLTFEFLFTRSHQRPHDVQIIVWFVKRLSQLFPRC